MTASVARILIIGNSYGGISALKSFLKHTESVTSQKFDITVIDPRAGFINIMAMPKAIIDVQFAKDTFIDLSQYGVIWDSILLHHDDFDSNGEKYNQVLRQTATKDFHYGNYSTKHKINGDNVKLHFVQGYVTKLHANKVEYTTGKLTKQNTPQQFSTKKVSSSTLNNIIDFDYCIVASGRGRNWPFDPIGANREEFAQEMQVSLDALEKSKHISVIGGGALGIEIAGEVKYHYHDSKQVELVHPHSSLPPEPLVPDEFKAKVLDAIKEQDIAVKLNSRVKEIDGQWVLSKTNPVDNEPMQSDLHYWCNYHKNNIQFLENADEKLFPWVRSHGDEVAVTEFLEVKKTDTESYSHIFAIGDISNLPVLKTAGGAFRQGEIAANNIFQHIITDGNNDKVDYQKFPFSDWPLHAMVLLVGGDKSVYSQADGKITLNDDAILKLYKDYRNSNINEVSGLKRD